MTKSTSAASKPRPFPRSGLDPAAAPWEREVESRIIRVEKSLSQLAAGETNANKAQSGQTRTLSDTIRAMPIPSAYYGRLDDFGLSGPVYVTQSVEVPENKTKVVLTAIGNAQAIDTASGGLAVAQAYIEVNGPGFIWSSPLISASKDTGASAVNNILTPALGFQQGDLVPGESFLVALALDATNPSAFPANPENFATLTITAIFFD